MKLGGVLLSLAFTGVYSLATAPSSPASEALTGLENVANAITSVRNGIQGLTSAVSDWAANTDPTAILVAEKRLLGILQAGTVDVTNSHALGLSDATVLLQPLVAIPGEALAAFEAISRKKDQIQDQGLCIVARAIISLIRSRALAFANAVINKLPALVQPVAQVEVDKSIGQVAIIEDMFSPQNCIDAAA